ncbi:SDR family NAD(P)-dependent oxidoreductase [Salirhabdus salicampi]|uniref:SDR family NAD(P)-dependent oxidoreductase n=1 Tax=Salirhabdus salicampi TaxID=476102 RepID=UPI0020C21FE5|nr:SDR family oxidoreductase [Salirhabdus salicampi]MCP8615991.1 SDR family oxidoreductase [Salirhabdus salicampi]
MSFENDTVIITGGANGIGKGLAYTYANKQATVILIDIDKQNGMKVANELRTVHDRIFFYECDIRNPNDIEATVHSILGEVDVPTILINNAGISAFQNLFDVTVEQWDNVINTNLRSVFLWSQKMAHIWKDLQIKGRIVNIASTRAYMSEKDSEAYAATKGGIVALTHSLAMSLSPYYIRVNSISPGWIETNQYDKLRDIDHEQHPSRRVGKPSDIGKSCLYLTDVQNDFVNGEDIVVDGGMTRKMIYEH